MYIYVYIYIYTEGYSESTEPIDAVNILPLARFEPTTSATPPSTTPDADTTNCATDTSPKKDVQEALIFTTTDAVHVVYWFFFSMDGIYFVLIYKKKLNNISPWTIFLLFLLLPTGFLSSGQ